MRSKREPSWHKKFDRLPSHIKRLAEQAYARWKENPFDPALENEQLHDTKKGRHRAGSRSVSITHRYRAIYVEDVDPEDGEPVALWYWVGTHEDYNNFVGSRRG